MRFEDWEPIYLEILDDFGFSRDRDEEAARLLSVLQNQASKSSFDYLDDLIRNKKVLVCGNAPRLAQDLENVRSIFDLDAMTVIAADGATTLLLNAGIAPQIIVTDLDGFVPDVIAANKKGSVVVVHAHGDNIKLLKKYVPKLSKMIGTTQSRPFDEIHNFGGFTDGDRCVFLAKRFRAAEIKLIGFDYEDPDVTSMKKKKLKWARKLVDMALGSSPSEND
ncbi:MAG: 6-hydroxymethylpterin diphosphokinase MptE-like protein [Methanotrichaceae archaeon]